MNDDAFFYQTCGGVAVGAGLPHFQSAAKAPQAFGANVNGPREGDGDVVSSKMGKEHNIDDEE